MKTKLRILFGLFVILLIAGSVISILYYEKVFAKIIQGEIVGIDRVTEPTMVVGGNTKPSDMFSFAVAVRSFENQRIYTSSTEDRRWGLVTKGQCAEVRFFPYPPWNLEKRGTYFGARLIELFECPKKEGAAAAPAAPAPSAAASADQPTAPAQPTTAPTAGP